MDTLLYLLKIGLGLGLVMSTSCSTAQNHRAQAAVAPLLHFQKTPCLGTCPSYEATVLENGTIRFFGYSDVPVVDSVTFTLTPRQLEALRQDISQLDYTALRDTYLTNWSDMPSTITTFYKDGKEVKRVKQEEGGPKALLDFQEKVHTLLMDLADAEAKRRLPIR
ncbi:DUF6438 domain-containing protein [Pontibacter indicus]|uniref:DUF6438 domain-containing protein n=1 Tax=Pontibacter indicus TaxID=1317125 RepID=A0A1R3WHN7_9BACT|nr:DUF6438 domain-containing protein [Pontibacter indicus]SIT76764.1 hypothetical protein SAMN05444128_0388 [Pontibacter indicus]